MAGLKDHRSAQEGHTADRGMVDRRAAPNRIKIREVAGVFRSKAVEDAVKSLMLAGIDRADIDLVGDIGTLERKLGGVFAGAEDLANLPTAPRRPFVGTIDGAVALSVVAGSSAFACGAAAAWGVVASGGETWAAAGAAIVCSLAGGGVGAWLAYRWLKGRFEWELDRQIAAMGVVVWVRVRSPEQEETALRMSGSTAPRRFASMNSK